MKLTCNNKDNAILMSIPSNDPAPSASSNNLMVRETLKEIMNGCLSEKEKAALDYRFGLTDGYCRNLDEIGFEFIISRSCAQQIIAMALRKIRLGLNHGYYKQKNKEILQELFNSINS